MKHYFCQTYRVDVLITNHSHMFKAVLDYENCTELFMTLQPGRPVSQMQYVRHLLGANCWQGWWHGKSDLQCLELSRR